MVGPFGIGYVGQRCRTRSAGFFFPTNTLMSNLPTDTAVTGGSAISVTLSSTKPHVTRKLYAAGAWFVLPAGLTCCLKPPSAFR